MDKPGVFLLGWDDIGLKGVGIGSFKDDHFTGVIVYINCLNGSILIEVRVAAVHNHNPCRRLSSGE